MTLAGIVLRNILHHRRKTVPVLLLCGLFFLLPAASWLLVHQIVFLAERPLDALNTELILQHDSVDKDAATVKTRGLVEPFNLKHFNREEAVRALAGTEGVDRYSTVLVLWEFDPQNTLTVVGLDPADPPVGLRKIEELLMPGSRFFSGSGANEVILERHFAKLFGHKRGQIFRLADHDLAIIGLVDFTEQSNLSNASVFLPYDTALAIAGAKERVVNQGFISLTGAAQIKKVSDDLARAFPGYSLISRDSLYKNLSAFNRLVYSGGRTFVLLVTPLSFLLLSWVLKMFRVEFAPQVEVLRVLGWPAGELRRWKVLELGYLIAGGLLLAIVMSLFLYFLALPHLRIAPLLDQGFQL